MMRSLVILVVALTGCETLLGIPQPHDVALDHLDLKLGPPSNQFVALTPAFDPAVTSYTASIPPTAAITVNATAGDVEVFMKVGTSTSMTGCMGACASLNANVDLSPGSTKAIDVRVSLDNGFAVDYVIEATVGGADFDQLPMQGLAMPTQSMTAGDFDGDGIDDLAVLIPGAVQLLRGRASGTFDASLPSIATGCSATAIASGDLDHDGIRDLVFVCSDQAIALRGTGAGQFAAAVSTGSAGSGFNSVAVGDLNDDLRDDIAIASQNGTFKVFESGAPGITLSLLATAPPLGPSPYSVAIGQLDTAAGNDAVVLGTTAMSVFKHDGLTQSPSTLGLPNSNGMIAIGDFDAKGGLDYAVIDDGPIGRLAIVSNFFPTAITDVIDLANGAAPRAVAVADLDQDGRDDIVVETDVGPDVFFGSSTGFRELPFPFPLTPPPNARVIAIGDFTGDGRLDIAIGTGSAILLYPGIKP